MLLATCCIASAASLGVRRQMYIHTGVWSLGGLVRAGSHELLSEVPKCPLLLLVLLQIGAGSYQK